jgi:large subunit ribosomal protein L33
MKKKKKKIIKLINKKSSYYYTTTKNIKIQKKIKIKKYDPITKKHQLFEESKIK